MITIRQLGDFRKLDKYFTRSLKFIKMKQIEPIIQQCIKDLAKATPKDTGLTSESWDYTIRRKGTDYHIEISNSNIQNGVNVALILQFGHATKNGAWIEGIDYISPVIREAYKKILDKTWEEVTGL